jgi:hypothetical protein
MPDTWDPAVKAAKKILGPKGKLPDFPPNIAKTASNLGKSWNGFVAAQKALEAAYGAHLKNWDLYQGAHLSFIDDMERSNLGLDAKNKDDAKKISEAKKPLMTSLHKMDNEHKANLTKFQNLGSHVRIVAGFVEPN